MIEPTNDELWETVRSGLGMDWRAENGGFAADTLQARLEAAEARMENIEAKLAVAVQALTDITNPVAKMVRDANACMCGIDGNMAVQLANSPGYYKGLAHNALCEIGLIQAKAI